MSSIRWAFNTRLWLNSAENWKKCLSSIQAEEVDRLSQFVFQNSAVSSMIGRILLRRWATKRLRLPWTQVKFERTEKGRPYLVWPEGVPPIDADANVSHQGDWVILASSNRAKIGVDVMKLEYSGGKSVEEFFRLMNRQFTSEEWSTITEGSDEQSQLASFYRHWCLKEAVVKALGIGIGYDLRKLSFQIATKSLTEATIIRDTTVTFDAVQDLRWHFEEYKLDDNHCAAVAYVADDVKCHLNSSPPLSSHSSTVQHNRSSKVTTNSPDASEVNLDPFPKHDLPQSSSELSVRPKVEGREASTVQPASSDSCCCGFEHLSLSDILEDVQQLSPVSDELVQLFVSKEKAAWL